MSKKYPTEEERLAAIKRTAQECYQRNQESRRERNRKWHEDHPNWQREHDLRKHGITLEDYNRLLERQKGVCAICGGECPSGRNLSVDHNHETGKVRGLLCLTCNSALGRLDKNRDWATKAIEYLIRADQQPAPAMPGIVQSP